MATYGEVPIGFEVRSVYDVAKQSDPFRRFTLTEHAVGHPYFKDYDAMPGNNPTDWPQHFDMSNWGIFGAHLDGSKVGAAVVAYKSSGLDMLEGRQDLAVLWDIRVVEAMRGRGVGHALFRGAEEWARTRGCRELKVETQNNNVDACRFYLRQGCVLRSIDRTAYPAHPEEIQMLFYKTLV